MFAERKEKERSTQMADESFYIGGWGKEKNYSFILIRKMFMVYLGKWVIVTGRVKVHQAQLVFKGYFNWTLKKKEKRKKKRKKKISSYGCKLYRHEYLFIQNNTIFAYLHDI